MTEFLIQTREIEDHRKLEFVIQSFSNLEIGESIVIIEDQDPQNLVQEIERFLDDDCNIEFMNQGPTEWRVRFIKQKTQGCCGCCGA